MNRIFTIAASLLLLISTSLFAQTEARITTMHVVKGDPNGLFTVSIRCDGETQFNLTRSQLTVTDNGTPVDDFSIVESSSPTVRNPFSAVMVMDASGSMSGSPNAQAKAAGHSFVDFMDGVVDEAAVIWFTQVVTKYQGMTTVKLILHGAVDALPASGATAVWDGIWEGLIELQTNGLNSKKAVVVLTDGGDNSSTHTPAQIIQLAQLYNLRVFTIGLGSAVNATELQLVALLTGGSYFQTPNANDLQTIFTQIANFMGHGFEEHTVAFKTPDPGAAEHEIQISVVACGETVASNFKEAAVTTTGVARAPQALPFALELGQNVPNPFSPSGETVIPYTLSGIDAPQPLRLEVFDLLGRRMATLVDADVLPGSHLVRFDARGLAPGMYLYRLSSGSVTTTRNMIVR